MAGSHVADCAGEPQWAVIMSKGSKYTRQVVEVDFQYPSEGIHYHWDEGDQCHRLKAAPWGSRELKDTPSCRCEIMAATAGVLGTIP